MPPVLRALVIDDSEDDALMLLRALERGGFEVVHRRVERADQVLVALADHTWDVVYLDWVMPGFGGEEALELVLADDPDRPVIVLSGVYGEALAIEAMAAGAHDYINKRRPERLVAATTRELRHGEVRRLGRAASDEREALITRERLARAEAEQASALQAMKNRFVSGISHELRTPLTSIRGYAEFLEDGLSGPLNPGQREFVAKIQHSTRQLEQLVDDLLDFACLEAGTFRLYRRETDLGEMLGECLACLKPLAAAAGLQIEAHAPAHAVMVLGDPQRLGQVLLNVIDNAIKFTPSGGRVTIGLAVEDGEALVSIADTGIGIADGQLPRIFQRFYQADSSLTREHGGAGLGLAIAQALTAAHGGRLDVRSQLDRGSTFVVRLPMYVGSAGEVTP